MEKSEKKAKLRKILKITGISVAALLIIIGISVFFFLGHIIKTTMQTVGPQVLGAPVKVSRVYVNLISVVVEINGLHIGNPEGYKHDRALTVKKMRLDLLRSSLFAKKLVIEEFTLDGVDVFFEPSSTLLSNNLSQLNNNVQSFTEKLLGPQKKAEKPAPKKEVEQQKLQVDKLALKNIYVNVVASAPGLPSTSAPIPVLPIVLDGLGKDEEGVTALDVTTVVLNKLTLGVFATIGDALPSLKSITNAGASLLNTTSGAISSIGNTTSGAISSIGGMISGGSKDQKAPAKDQKAPAKDQKAPKKK